jgi:flagellar biosynthesis GTPase FlhF
MMRTTPSIIITLMLASFSPLWASATETAEKPAAITSAATATAPEAEHSMSMFKHHDSIGEKFKQLGKDLQLTPTQSKAWDKVVKNIEDSHEKMKKQFHEHMKEEKGEHPAPISALERMEKQSQMLEEHAKESKVHLVDFKQFYTQLKPEQQKKVDDFFAHFHQFHPKHGHMGMFHGQREHDKAADEHENKKP